MTAKMRIDDSANQRGNVPQEILQKEIQDGLIIASDYPAVGTEVAYSGFPLSMQLLDAT